MPQPSNEEIQRRLEEVLSGPEFGGNPPVTNLLQQILLWLAEWLNGLQGSGSLVYWLLIAACIGLLVLLAAYIVLSVRRFLFVSSSQAIKAKAKEQRDRLSVAYGEEALRRAEREEYTEATRFLFLSLVYRFDENGRVNFRRAYTNREYVALFADRPPLYADLKLFVDLLDDNWYGEHPSTREQFEQCHGRYRALAN